MHKACNLYAHITWCTWRRTHAIRRADLSTLASAVNDAAGRSGVHIHAFAALKDHVHLIVSNLPNVALADFIRDAKSESSRRINQRRAGEGEVRWGRGYYAGSLSDSHVTAARNYVGGQYKRHPLLIPE